MSFYGYMPGPMLSCALAPLDDYWKDGYTIMQQIQYAFEFGKHDPLFGNKAQVVKLAIETSYWRQESDGHGNKAARREAYLSMPKDEMTPQELDAMLEKMNRQHWSDRQAEMKTEGRVRS